MKPLSLLVVCAALVLNACRSASYLPEAKNIPESPHGSYVMLKTDEYKHFGELIAIDTQSFYIMIPGDGDFVSLTKIPIQDVEKFRIRYAQPRHYWLSVPAGVLVGLLHGYMGVISVPVNLIVTVSVSVSGEIDFQANNRQISLDELKMFARFPQGLPSGITVH